MKKIEFLSASQIVQRGWTKTMIRDFLGNPDQLATNPHYQIAAQMKLYKIQRVKRIEKQKRFATAQEKSKRRRTSAKASAEKRAKQVLEYVEGLEITIPEMQFDMLIETACQHYNELWNDRGQHDKRASVTDGPEFLYRIARNFLRHECSHYEQELGKLFGKIGQANAYECLRERVNDAISEVYPELTETINEMEYRSNNESI